MTVAELAQVLVRLGCPAAKADLMARQLDRRAQMDAARTNESYEAALHRLIGLMSQGWAAQPRSTPPDTHS